MSSNSSPTLLCFSTRDLRDSERVAYWREHCKVTDIELQSDRSFEAEGMLLRLPGLRVARCRSESPARWNRTAELLKDGDDDFALVISLAGKMQRSQRGQEIEIDAGDGVGTLHAEPFSVRFNGSSQHLVLMMQRSALAPLVPNVEAAATRLVQRDSDALRLLRRYLQTLLEGPDITDARLGALVADHVRDLLALAVGATRDGAAVAAGRGLRAARLKAIKDDFAANSTLSLSALAASQRVSPRYVQLLFEAEGTTFTAYALEQRLARAHRMLCDLRHAGWTISAIALEAGFGDLSHFNRSFRRRYGVSPSEVRAQTRPLAKA